MTYMKRLFIILTLAIVFMAACKKQFSVRTSGTDTIDNIKHLTTFVYGFSFSQAKLVETGSDIVLDLKKESATLIPTLQANNRLPSFLKVGEYANEDEAKNAFDNLKTIPEPQQWLDMADPIAPNQVWIYRSNNEKYTKFRIVEVKIEKIELVVDYAECTFQWIHQPDGSVNFP